MRGTNDESTLPATPREKLGDSSVHVFIAAEGSSERVVDGLHEQIAKQAFVIACSLSKLAQNNGQEA